MIEVNKRFYREFRCTSCRRLLAHEYVFNGRIIIKCKCGEYNKLECRTPKHMMDKILLQDSKDYNPDEEIVVKRQVSLKSLKGGEKQK